MKVALYARYSSDIQRDTSIADQFRLCRLFADGRGWSIHEEYSDHAITGSTLLLRPGLQRMMQDAMQHRFDVLLAESLDRFSRDQEDTAGLFKRLRFLGVSLVTLGEGEITELHVGFKGTMNALYLKDLADKTRRGLRGRIEAGKSGGGRCFGYRVVRGTVPGVGTTGEREIDPVESAIVVRIFQQYGAGISPKAIAHALNRESIAGPFGGTWSPSTIHGNPDRGTGILNNELYVGRLVWNRLRYVRDPDTGKRVSRLNPAAEWIASDVPHLRIVPDDLWQKAKARQANTRKQYDRDDPRRFNRHRRPTYLFSGLTKCGVCGGGYVVYSRERLGCFSARARGICLNRLTISRREVEERVLRAIRDQLMRRDFFEDFCRDYTREMNRLRMEYRASLTSAEREIARIEARRKKLIEMVLEDQLPASEIKGELIANAARREELQRKLEMANEPPPLLHPQMSDVYREQVSALYQALEQEDGRSEATEGIRQLVEAIILEPEPETAWQSGSRVTSRRCLALPKAQKGRHIRATFSCQYNWLRGRDLNPRPLGYEPNELPGCSTPRQGLSSGDLCAVQPKDRNTRVLGTQGFLSLFLRVFSARPLLVGQGLHGRNRRGSVRWAQACGDRDDRQHSGGGGQRGDVNRRDVEEDGLHRVAGEPGAGYSQRRADGEQPQRDAQELRADLLGMGAQRHAEADFSSSLRDGVAQHAVGANRGEQQC